MQPRADDAPVGAVRHGFLHLGDGYWQRIAAISAVAAADAADRKRGWESAVFATGQDLLHGGARLCALTPEAVMATVHAARQPPAQEQE